MRSPLKFAAVRALCSADRPCISGAGSHRDPLVARDVGPARQASGKLAADFNASQSEYRIVPTYKGNYTETVTASIFAFRSRSQPAIVQVNEIATATMMAARGAIYPVYELMRDQTEAFSPEAYLPAVTGYYSDVAGNMLSFPFNASTPILYYNKDCSAPRGSIRTWRRKPGPTSALPPRSCARREPPAASPRRGPPGSMSRIFRPFTTCRSRPGKRPRRLDAALSSIIRCGASHQAVC